MKIKIAILGSTGSIGNTTLNIIKKNRSKFDVELLTANNNYKKIIKQAKIFRPKNILISNKKHYLKVKKQLNNRSTKVFFGEKPINHIIKKKNRFYNCSHCWSQRT